MVSISACSTGDKSSNLLLGTFLILLTYNIYMNNLDKNNNIIKNNNKEKIIIGKYIINRTIKIK